jgi:hypothetical protein
MSKTHYTPRLRHTVLVGELVLRFPVIADATEVVLYLKRVRDNKDYMRYNIKIKIKIV